MIKQKFALSYLSKILLQIFQFSVTIVVARVAGASVMGTVAFATSFVSLFTIFFDMGQGVAHIKLVSEGQDEKKCNGIYFRIQLILSVVFFLVSLSFFLFSKYLLAGTFESKVHEQVVLIAIFTISIGNLFFIPRTTFNARVEQARADIPDLLRQVIYQFFRLCVVLVGYGALAISLSNLAATILIIPFYWYLFKGTQWGEWDKSLFKKYVSISLPVFVTNIVDILSQHSDKVLLQFFYGSSEVGYYVAGFSIGSLILLIGNSLGLILLPTFSREIADNNQDNVSKMVEKFERFTWLFIFPVTLLTSIGSDLIVTTILGDAFHKTVPVLSFITFSAFFSSYFVVYGVILSGSGFFRLNAGIYAVKFIFLIGAAIIAIHPQILHMGAKGLALCLMLSNIFAGLLFVYYVKKRQQLIRIFSSSMLIFYSLAVIVPAFFIYGQVGNLSGRLSVLAAIPLLFWAGAAGLRLMKLEDIRFFLALVNPSLMKNYIKSELKNKR